MSMRKFKKYLTISTWIIAIACLIVYISNGAGSSTWASNVLNKIINKTNAGTTAEDILGNTLLLISLTLFIVSFVLTLLVFKSYNNAYQSEKQKVQFRKHQTKKFDEKELKKAQKSKEKEAAKLAKAKRKEAERLAKAKLKAEKEAAIAEELAKLEASEEDTSIENKMPEISASAKEQISTSIETDKGSAADLLSKMNKR